MRKLSNHRFQLFDYHIRRFVAQVPENTTLKEVMHPEYFANVMRELLPGKTIVHVISDDLELRADIFLIARNETTVEWEVNHVYSEPGKKNDRTDLSKATPFEVNWGGPQHKWRVLHDGKIVETGFESKSVAEARAANM